MRLQPAFELKLAGPADALAVEMNVRSSAGDATGKFVADVEKPGQSVRGTVSVRHLNLAPIVNDARQRTDLTADARLDIRAPSFSDLESMHGTVSVNAPRLVASGYTAQDVKVDARVDGRRIEGRGQAAAYGAAATAAGRLTLPKGESRSRTICVGGRATSISGGCREGSGFHRSRPTLIPGTRCVESSRSGGRRPEWLTAICGSTTRQQLVRVS